MGQSAGAVNVYAVMTSPLVVNANPALVHRFVPISGGIALASEVPAGSIATLAPASAFLGQADYLLANLVIGDGLAADLASATAYIASQTPEQIATYVRSKSAATIVHAHRQAGPARASGSGPIPDGDAAHEPDRRHRRRPVRERAAAGGQHARRRQAVPDAVPLAGGTGSARLCRRTAVRHPTYKPNAAPQTTIEQWIPPSYLPITAPVTGFNAKADQLNQIFFLDNRDNVLGR